LSEGTIRLPNYFFFFLTFASFLDTTVFHSVFLLVNGHGENQRRISSDLFQCLLCGSLITVPPSFFSVMPCLFLNCRFLSSPDFFFFLFL